MSDAKYTAGPWRFSRNRNSRGGVIIDAKGSHVAEVRVGAKSADEAQANARLLTASPDLLEACKAALLEINGESPDVELAPLRWQLEAALARAGQAVPS